MASPRLTVVTPSYNQGRYLEQTVRSVLDQHYDNLEYIVMDGGSTDNSVFILRRYENRLDFWQSRPDGGQGSAIIAGWGRASGDYFTWINSDDLLLPGSLHAVAERAESGEPDIITGDELGIDSSGNVTSDRPKWRGPRWMYDRGLLHLGQPGTFYRRSLVEQVGYFESSLEFSMEYDLQMRLLRAGAVVEFIDAPLAALRHHADTKSNTGREAFSMERRAVYESHIPGLFGDYRLRESAVQILRYPYAFRYLLPRNWGHAKRVRRIVKLQS